MIDCGMRKRLVEAIYAEVLALADEAKIRFGEEGKAQRLALVPMDKLGLAVESMRVTTRLMHLMGWALIQKAHMAGEITDEEEAEQGFLPAVPVPDARFLDRFPEEVVEIIEASCNLYRRAARLEDDTPSWRALNPVGAMASRLASFAAA